MTGASCARASEDVDGVRALPNGQDPPPFPAGRTTLDGATYSLFKRLSRARRARFFHPRGISYRGTLTVFTPGVTRGVQALAPGFTHPALVRFSCALGLPSPSPDLLGLALRLPDVYGRSRHQDLLLASSGNGLALNVLPRPTRSFFGGSFSTLLPYRAAGRLVLLGAFAATPSASSRSDPLEELAETAGRATLRFVLTLARPWSAWEPVALVSIEDRLPPDASEDLRFNPAHTGGQLDPAGLLNDVRGPAYRGSQEGREDARRGPAERGR